MPVIGTESFANFAQVINQQHATAVEFATAIARLKQAEEQFKVRQRFEQEIFSFDRQKWQAEKSLLDTKLQRMEYENTILQKDIEVQKKLPGALSKLSAGIGKVAAASATGDVTKVQEAIGAMSKVFEDPEVADSLLKALPLTQDIATAYGLSPQLVTQALGKGLKSPEFLGGTELLKFEKELNDQLMRNMTGASAEELEKQYSARLQANNQHRMAVTSQVSTRLGQLRLKADAALTGDAMMSALRSKIERGDTQALAEVGQGLQQLSGQIDDPNQVKEINNWIQAFRQVQESNAALEREHLVNRQKQAMASTIATNLVNKQRALSLSGKGIGYLTKPGSTIAAAVAMEESQPAAAALSKLFDDLSGTKPYRTFMETADATLAEQNLTLIMNEVAAKLPDVELQKLFERGLRRAKEESGATYQPAAAAAPPPAVFGPPSTGGITLGPSR